MSGSAKSAQYVPGDYIKQRAFFKSVYGKKDASPYEFDRDINCDYLLEPQWAASNGKHLSCR